MILAAAQFEPFEYDIDKNLKEHYRLIGLAANHGADLVVFPEMSITGYTRDHANELSFSMNDTRLEQLRELSKINNLIIIAGAPIHINSKLYIGAFIINPNGTISIYTKQYLHSGEEAFFQSSFQYNPLVKLKNDRISLAICADIDHPQHAKTASNNRATVYIASLFFSTNGIAGAHSMLSQYAKEHSLNVLMSNYIGKTWEVDSGGRSAFWDKTGELVVEMNTTKGLLIVEKNEANWNDNITNNR